MNCAEEKNLGVQENEILDLESLGTYFAEASSVFCRKVGTTL